jgi:transcriptional regulator with XRE-family HTH domain
MMKSLLKSTVAVVRNEIDQTVDEFAELLGCSVWTVRRLERKDLKLSEKLARKIQEETGAPAEWLLKNDPSLPAQDCSGLLWSKHAFEVHQGKRESAELSHTLFGTVKYKRLPAEKRKDRVRRLAKYLAARAHQEIHACLASAITKGEHEFERAVSRVSAFTESMEKDFGCDESVRDLHAKNVAIAAHESSRDETGMGQEIYFAETGKNYRIKRDGRIRKVRIQPSPPWLGCVRPGGARKSS